MDGPVLEPTAIPGLHVVHASCSTDERGAFTKTFIASEFTAAGLAKDFAEEYHTLTRGGVVRGMHFQVPPCDHEKMVFCLQGAIFDVVLDLRVGSPTYATSLSFRLSGADAVGLYIPSGCAHGFAVLSDQAITTYRTTTPYSPRHDAGVLWSSVAGVVWPLDAPIVSKRDARLPACADYSSPFTLAAETP
jgi:dTDP-4-dehydrorhamnose 3,5-epimerase